MDAEELPDLPVIAPSLVIAALDCSGSKSCTHAQFFSLEFFLGEANNFRELNTAMPAVPHATVYDALA